VGFALLGLAMAVLSYVYAAVYDYTKPTNGLDVAVQVAFLILCPAQLLFAFCIDCEVIGRDGLLGRASISASRSRTLNQTEHYPRRLMDKHKISSGRDASLVVSQLQSLGTSQAKACR
jgi:hypothetical protein